MLGLPGVSLVYVAYEHSQDTELRARYRTVSSLALAVSENCGFQSRDIYTELFLSTCTCIYMYIYVCKYQVVHEGGTIPCTVKKTFTARLASAPEYCMQRKVPYARHCSYSSIV